MKYQVFLAEDWVDVNKGELIDSPWDTKALKYELLDGTSGHTLHWRAVEDAVKPEKLGRSRELKTWKQASRIRHTA